MPGNRCGGCLASPHCLPVPAPGTDTSSCRKGRAVALALLCLVQMLAQMDISGGVQHLIASDPGHCVQVLPMVAEGQYLVRMVRTSCLV